jgi:hypothetical protein
MKAGLCTCMFATGERRRLWRRSQSGATWVGARTRSSARLLAVVAVLSGFVPEAVWAAERGDAGPPAEDSVVPSLSDDDDATDAAFSANAPEAGAASARRAGPMAAWLYPLDFVPPRESSADIRARERHFEVAWSNHFARLDALVNGADPKALDAFIKGTRGDQLYLLATEYGYPQLRAPALAKLRQEFLQHIEKAKKALAPKGIADIGEALDLGRALHAAIPLQRAGAYTPDLAAAAEALIEQHVERKSVFWGFTRKYPYFLSGYNKEVIIMDLAASIKALYAGTGTFPHTIDAFDAAWTQLTTEAYETDNSPHYDSSVNLHYLFGWVMRLNLADDLKRSPHFRMLLDRMAWTVMANGESANYGKSMCRLTARTVEGVSTDELWVDGAGIGTCLRWAYRLYGDPHYLYVARKYELTAQRGRAPVDVWPRAYDLNFFAVQGAAYSPARPLAATTIRLKGPGYGLDRGVRRENVQPVQDKLILNTGSDPRGPSLVMDLSFTQSKVKDQRRMGIDNHLFNGAHTVTVAGRPDNPEETNRIFLMPDDVTYPGTGEFAKQKTTNRAAQAYALKDYRATRVNAELAYGEVEYDRLQYAGVHARRKLALLNNGVLVVEDTVWADESYAGGLNAGALYNVWSKVLEQGTNWVITSPRVGHLPDGLMDDPQCALIYIAPAADLTPGLNQDIDLYAHAKLTRDQPVRIVSAVIPMPYAAAKTNGRRVGDGLRAATDAAGNTTVLIPFSAQQTLRVSFLANGFMPAFHTLENNAGPLSLAAVSYNLKHPAHLPFTVRTPLRRIEAAGRMLTPGTDYTVSASNGLVRLQAAMLNRLPPGSHDFRMAFEDGRAAALRVAVSDTRLNARANRPYAVAFGRWDEHVVTGFKADLDLNENALARVTSGGRALRRDVDYTACGSVVALTPAYARTLLQQGGRPDLTLGFTSGADVVLRMNAETNRCITLYNARHAHSYTDDQMIIAVGLRDNHKVKAVGGDYTIAFYEDFLYRGKPTMLTVKDGETRPLASKAYKSFRVRRTDES